MKTKLQTNQKGFTIIEVLIVLAIAGLILLIVFLAVPALQRNSRNTQLKTDVQNVLGGISEYQSNNNGKMPTNISGTGEITISRGSDTPTQTTKVNGGTAVSVISDVPTSPPDAGTVQVRLGARCDEQTNARAVAVYYSVETSGEPSQQCQDS